MSEITVRLTGAVIDENTAKGIAGLRVVGWDSDTTVDDRLGEAITDKDGQFSIEWDPIIANDGGKDPGPDVILKIYDKDKLIFTTKPIRNWTPANNPFVVKLAAPSLPVKTLRLFVLLLGPNDKPAVGVQLVLNYDLASGETWSSELFTSSEEGKLAVDLPQVKQNVIDWDRSHFTITKNNKPLIVENQSQVLPVEAGFTTTIKLAISDIQWPPGFDPNKWYVRGRVTTAYGETVTVDVSVESISLRGEQNIGHAETDDTGRYELEYDWTEECPPDIKITAYVDGKPVAESPINFTTGKSKLIDIIVGDEVYIGPTEYQRVEEQVLKCNGDFNVAEIGSKQFDYLLGKTRLDKRLLEHYLTARFLSDRSEVAPQVFYALFRGKLPTSLQGLVLQDERILKTALYTSIERNFVERKYKNSLGALQTALRQLAIEGSLTNNQQLGHAGVADLLNAAEVPQTVQAPLINFYLDHNGDDKSFWEALSTHNEFSDYASKIKLSLQVGALSLYHVPTLEAFNSSLGATSEIKSLIKWQEQDWLQFASGLNSVPDSITGDTLEERTQKYINIMQLTIRRAFPLQFTTENVFRSDTFNIPVLHDFLSENQDFDYRNSSIPVVLDNTGISGEQRLELEKTLKGMQRLYRLAPLDQKFEIMETLYADDVTSARDITLMGQAQFVSTYEEPFGDRNITQFVFHNAQAVAMIATNLAASYYEMAYASDIYAIGGGIAIPQSNEKNGVAVPSYKDLFGSQSYCECEHCSSVYSPAAYFVDQLQFLGESLVTKKLGGTKYVQIEKDGELVDKTGLDVLFKRRPGVGDIKLNCKNTNTVMPYIDLVNELFENAVAPGVVADAYQTTWTEAELKANPENINQNAYTKLAEAVYPFNLPFQFWNIEAENYLDHLGVKRWALMETVLDTPDSGQEGFAQVCLAYLNLSKIDAAILTGTQKYSGSTAAVGRMWGYAGAGWQEKLGRVSEFLLRSGLNYDEFLDLLQVNFISPEEPIFIDFSTAESPCDIENAVLHYLDDNTISLTVDTFDRIQRFLRLCRKTGWSIWELNRVLADLKSPNIIAKTLTQVAVIKRLTDSLSLDVLEILCWWSTLDTALDETDEDYRSYYETAFVNRAVLNPADEVFLLNDSRTELEVVDNGGALISEHLPSIAAALQLTESETSLLTDTLRDVDDNIDDKLNLANLSQLYRIASLARATDLDINEFQILQRLVNADVWNLDKPQGLIKFISNVDIIKNSGFSVNQLGFLLLHNEFSVTNEQMPALEISQLLIDIQIAVRAVWANYEISSIPVQNQLRARFVDYLEQQDIDKVMEVISQEPGDRITEDEDYLLEVLGFLDKLTLSDAINNVESADVRYLLLLNLLNRYGRRSNSIAIVSQIVADAFGLDLSAAQVILNEVITVANNPNEYIISVLLDSVFIQSHKEKLVVAIEPEFLQEAIAVIETISTMPTSDIDDFITKHFGFLNIDEAIEKLNGVEPLQDIVERYAYTTSALHDSHYEVTTDVFPDQFAAILNIQKTALVVSRFNIINDDLPKINQYASELKLLPLTGYPKQERQNNFAGFSAWQNMLNMIVLQNRFNGTDTDLFAMLEKTTNSLLINTSSINTEIDELIESGEWSNSEEDLSFLFWLNEFSNAVGWKFSDLQYIMGTHMLKKSLNDMRDLSIFAFCIAIIGITDKLGTSAAQVNAWSELDLADIDAANAKQSARAQYDLDKWYEVAPDLRNGLREQQRDALTAYLVHKTGFSTSAELYNYFLVDSEMSACMMTSRLKLAMSTVQLFTQRCILNLEKEFVEITKTDEWEWRKNYRVWEANRKVFLYPENYIRPELRITRSEIFDAAHSILLQNEVTQEVAEQSVMRFLEELDDISNIEIAGSFYEKIPPIVGKIEVGIDRLHVVGRTRGVPSQYYYRVRDKSIWTPWAKIDINIGVKQVLPVVINQRVYLFWPQFFEKQITGVDALSDKGKKILKIDQLTEEGISYSDYLEYLYNTHFNIDLSLYDPTDDGELPIVLSPMEQYAADNGLDLINEIGKFLKYLKPTGGTLHDSAYDDLEDLSLNILGYTQDTAIALLVFATNTQTWYEYSGSRREEIDGQFEGTISYFEIKLSLSEYRNGNWISSRTSEEIVLSDQKISAAALLEENQLPAAQDDFHFYSNIEGDVITVECIQSLHYSDGSPTKYYTEGSFDYDVLSKVITTTDPKISLEKKVDERETKIYALDRSTVTGNAFIEQTIRLDGDLENSFAIPNLPLLERTPGTFRVPIPHQYPHPQFPVNEPFFFGDNKRCFMVMPTLDAEHVSQEYFNKFNGVNSQLASYIGIDSPWLGVISKDSILTQEPINQSTIGNISSRTELSTLQLEPVTHYKPNLPYEYQFRSIFHPLVSELIQTVNGQGVTAALTRDMQTTSQKYFIKAYEPTEIVSQNYPLTEFSFSEIDANGLYNNELFFHLPLMIATRLSDNQQYAAAQTWFHLIFDPTSRAKGEGAQRFWQFKTFFDMYDNVTGHPFDSIYNMMYALAVDPELANAETVALIQQTEAQITEWRSNPFDPHAIAALRPVAYMKATVIAYIDNLIAWGDNLYEQFTHESINEATQYYILAYQILGDRPVTLPSQNIEAKSYNELGKLDAFSNALVEFESAINTKQIKGQYGSSIPPLYFCIPNNPDILMFWDTIEDRLFKIRHCMTIEGVIQQLPLFQPPIDPMKLVLARANGVSISSALAGLSTPAPHYRFVHLLQKAREYCDVVKGLGSQLLAAYEKKDAEELGVIRTTHEESLLNASTELRNLQVDEAKENFEASKKSKVLVEERINYYSKIKNRSEKENSATKYLDKSELQRKIAGSLSIAASSGAAVPNQLFTKSTETGAPPKFQIGLDNLVGGGQLSSILSATSSSHSNASAGYSTVSNKTLTDASYDRRWDDWQLQLKLAKKELKQVEKQIIAAEIRLALSKKERSNNAIQLEQTREVRDFLSSKFTNQELYSWMISQISSIYYQSYKLAFDLAKRCEKAYQRETGEYSKSFIAFGYFDSQKKGLLSGERLYHDIQRMEFDYLNTNRRELELTKNISLAELNPTALIALRETGECFFNLPEILFDFDYPGHYFRRIKSVSLTIPSITGPYTGLSSTLTLQSDKLRIVAKKSKDALDDKHMQINLAAVKSIATSSAQSDSGMFQADFRDERYLPFEGSGVISEWKLALNKPEFAQFKYDSISDVILQINYTARDGGEVFRSDVETELREEISNYFLTDQPLQQFISVKQFMADDWSRMSNQDGDGTYRLTLDLGLNGFPYYLRTRGLTIIKLDITLSGDVNDTNWDDVKSQNLTDAPFSIDLSLGLTIATFTIDPTVSNESNTIDIDLPSNVVQAINNEIEDIIILYSYKINKLPTALS